ncbi:MAG: 5-formyltetrahydrofolate cyclo-ligase [Halothiobacillaceae bacterium]
MHSLPPPDRKSLRTHYRAARRNLPSGHRHRYERRMLAALLRSTFWKNARHVALYLPNDGEADLTPLARITRNIHAGGGKRLYLPCLRADRSLTFRRWVPGTPLRRNRHGIGEPVGALPRPVGKLDLILMPLVGFDEAGNRLGMGGGFYDRSLAGFARKRGAPWLVGVAFELQRHPALPREPWDVPLDLILTERGLQKPRRI